YPIDLLIPQRLLPRKLLRVELGGLRIQCLSQRGDLFVESRELSGLFYSRDLHSRLFSDGLFLNVGEERRQAVEVARRVWIVLVIVTLGATQSARHPDRRK